MAPRVIITASTGAFPGLADALRSLPVEVEEHPLMTFAPPLDWAGVDQAIGELDRYEAVAFTSPRAARGFLGRMAALGRSHHARGTVWAGGAGTRQALGETLGPVRSTDQLTSGDLGAAAALAEAMLSEGVRGPVLFPCGQLRRDELPAMLAQRGVEVREAVCYRTVLADEADARLVAGRAEVLVVASPTVAALLARACASPARPALLAVGPTTDAASRAAGWAPAGVAAHPSAGALVAAVRTLLASGRSPTGVP